MDKSDFIWEISAAINFGINNIKETTLSSARVTSKGNIVVTTLSGESFIINTENIERF